MKTDTLMCWDCARALLCGLTHGCPKHAADPVAARDEANAVINELAFKPHPLFGRLTKTSARPADGRWITPIEIKP